MSKKQVLLTIAYDGTDYCGFQWQKNGVSVSEVLDKALSKIAGHPVRIMGVSRTDGGVHAQGQVASFFLEGSIPIANIPKAVSGHLPRDIVVVKAIEVPLGFNCRKEAVGKHYRYIVDTAQVPSPFDHRYVWYYPSVLDIEKMRKGAIFLEGDHDFRAFTAKHSGKDNFLRQVDKITIEQHEKTFIFDVWGPGFLYKMVRSIVGLLVDIGRGRFEPEFAKEILETGNRELLGYTAPALGLNLVKIYFDGNYVIDKDKNIG
ncbi:MAG: tRNA pseudouridine(38-40) synthase TruA [Clostridiales bacterium]